MDSFDYDSIIEDYCDTLKQEYPEIIIEPSFENESGEDLLIDVYAPSDILEAIQHRASDLADLVESQHGITVAIECHKIDEF